MKKTPPKGKRQCNRRIAQKFIIINQDEVFGVSLTGRQAWALEQLILNGSRGCTPIERPAPRWSAYIHQLRHLGIKIETIREKHGGQFSGTHGRYVLCSIVKKQALP